MLEHLQVSAPKLAYLMMEFGRPIVRVRFCLVPVGPVPWGSHEDGGVSVEEIGVEGDIAGVIDKRQVNVGEPAVPNAASTMHYF